MSSRELVSAVLNRNVGEVHINGSVVEVYPEDGVARSILNLYELVHKCKVWARKQGYNYRIKVNMFSLKEAVVYMVYDKQKRETLVKLGFIPLKDSDDEYSNTDWDFKACEWILKAKKDK